MTVVALAAFVTIEDKDGGNPSPFQNFDGQTITNNSDTGLNKFQNGRHQQIQGYKYLSFIYQGAAMNRSGDNLEASLILANSPLSMAYAKEFVEKKYYFLVETFLMTDDFSSKDTAVANGGRISGEYWLASSLRYDHESIEIVLSSPIDAVGANAPQQTLTKQRCAHLPLTGQVQNL
jgi:phage-related protein